MNVFRVLFFLSFFRLSASFIKERGILNRLHSCYNSVKNSVTFYPYFILFYFIFVSPFIQQAREPMTVIFRI